MHNELFKPTRPHISGFLVDLCVRFGGNSGTKIMEKNDLHG